MKTFENNFFKKIIIITILFPFFSFGQKVTDAEIIYESIHKIPKYSSISEFPLKYSNDEIREMKIKSVSICQNNNINNTKEKGCIKYNFNNNGNIVQSTTFDALNKLINNFEYVYFYNNEKRISKTIIKIKQNPYSLVLECKYDNFGNLIWRNLSKLTSSKPNTSEVEMEEVADATKEGNGPAIEDETFTEKYEYNSKNKLIKYELFHGNTTETIFYLYDSISENLHSKKSVWSNREFYLYTPHDRDKERWGNRLSEKITEEEYKYDNGLSNIVEIISKSDGHVYKYNFNYLKTGKFSDSEIENDGVLIEKKVYYYDEKNRIVKTENWSGNYLKGNSVISYNKNGINNLVQKEYLFTNTEHSETIRTFDSYSKLTQEIINITSISIGETTMRNNLFNKKITFEYFQ